MGQARLRPRSRTNVRRNLIGMIGVALGLGGIATGLFVDRPKAARELDRVLRSEISIASQQLDAFTSGTSIAMRATARQPDFAEAIVARVNADESTSSRQNDVTERRVAKTLIYLQGLVSLRLSNVTIYNRSGTALMASGAVGVVDPISPTVTTVESGDAAVPAHLFEAFWGSPGYVTISRPHRDRHGSWVLSLATPIVDEQQRKVGILEADTRLDDLRRRFAGRRYPTMLVNAETRRVELDSRMNVDKASRSDTAGQDSTFRFPVVPPTALSGAMTVDGTRIAWARIDSAGNDNPWLLAVSDRAPTGLVRGLGMSTFGPLVTGAILILLSVLSRRAERSRLEQAMTDELTGLPSRRLFKDRLEQAVLNAKRGGPNAMVGLLVLDLDRFKEVNDALGHSHGDRLLIEISHRLGGLLRDNDTIARLGGDEFAVLISTDRPAGDIEVAEKLLQAFAKPVSLDGLLVTVGASIGIARFPADGDDPERLLRCADVAMYHSKRNHLPWVRYAAENDPSDPARLELLSDLRFAIGTPQLELHYQPKVSLITDEVIGAEALLRWTHPSKGPISPATFVGIAEQTGVIAPLTDEVLRQAARQLRQWIEDGRPLAISVNVSAANLTEDGFVSRVRRIIEEEDAPAEFIVLELTESAVMGDHRRSLEVLGELSDIGFLISIDDFGTGYSSLSYLQRLPVDELKIDRSFVKTLVTDQVNRSIVRSTIDLGHNLGLSVVAEGVEDEETRIALAELGCDSAQGYHLSRPLPARNLEAWLDDRAARVSPTGTVSPTPSATRLPIAETVADGDRASG